MRKLLMGVFLLLNVVIYGRDSSFNERRDIINPIHEEEGTTKISRGSHSVESDEYTSDEEFKKHLARERRRGR